MAERGSICVMLQFIAGVSSRDKLLDAAADLARAHGPDAGLERITFSAVAGLSGVPPSTLYTIWPTVGDFHGDLLAELDDLGPLSIGATPITHHLAAGIAPLDLIGRWMQDDVEALVRSPRFELLVTASMISVPSRHVPEGSTRRVARAMRARSADTERTVAEKFALLLPYFGRRLRRRHEVADLILPLSALKVGAALALPIVDGGWVRDWVDDDGRAVSKPLLNIAAEVLFAAATEMQPDHPNARVWSEPPGWPAVSGPGRGQDRSDVDWASVRRDVVEADGGTPPSRWSRDLAHRAALKSGLSLSAAGGLRPGLGWIKLSRLLSDLGLSSGAAHATWADHEAFQAQLVYVLLGEMVEETNKADVGGIAAAIASADLSYLEMARRSVGLWRTLLEPGHRLRLQIGLWRWARYRPEADPGLREIYMANHRLLEIVVNKVLATHRRAPRHGITTSDLAWLVMMLLDGSDVLSWFQPERFAEAEVADGVRPSDSGAVWAPVALWIFWLGDAMTEPIAG